MQSFDLVVSLFEFPLSGDRLRRVDDPIKNLLVLIHDYLEGVLPLIVHNTHQVVPNLDVLFGVLDIFVAGVVTPKLMAVKYLQRF